MTKETATQHQISIADSFAKPKTIDYDKNNPNSIYRRKKTPYDLVRKIRCVIELPDFQGKETMFIMMSLDEKTIKWLLGLKSVKEYFDID